MIIAMARDTRVLVIKVADRLHNMRTIRFLPPEKQVHKAHETLEVIAPLAHRLGMATVKWELEDLSFAILHPKRYEEIVRLVADRAPSRDTYLARVRADIGAALSGMKITAEVEGRPAADRDDRHRARRACDRRGRVGGGQRGIGGEGIEGRAGDAGGGDRRAGLAGDARRREAGIDHQQRRPAEARGKLADARARSGTAGDPGHAREFIGHGPFLPRPAIERAAASGRALFAAGESG
jgi:hypothetical protein